MSSQENVNDIPSVDVRNVNFNDAQQAASVVALLDEYARSPYGGGVALAADAKMRLPQAMLESPSGFSGLAFIDDEAVGVVNCFETLSTFKARPVLNIHDIAVTAPWRGRGIGTQMLEWVQDQAVERGCCKITLEVLSGNEPAKAVYRRFGFEAYQLDDKFGQALFWQKLL